MKLVDMLIAKFYSEETGINFRKIFVSFCEDKLGKMDLFLVGPLSSENDEAVLEKKERIYGSVKLIGNLFNRGFAPDAFVKECIDKLMKNSQEDNIENAIHLLREIGKGLYDHYAFEAGSPSAQKHKGRVKHLKKEVFDDYLDHLSDLNQENKISARLKLEIKDLIRERENSWLIAFGQPQQKYVKKERDNSKNSDNVPVESFSDIELEAKKESFLQGHSPFGKALEQYKKSMLNEIIRVF